MGQSLAECTWEKQSSLPPKLIEDYESGVTFDVVDTMSQSVGQAVHTLLPTASTRNVLPDAKKARTSIPVVPQTNTGYIIL